MRDERHKLFDFSDYTDDLGRQTELIRRFASTEEFRSAVVEELELNDDFYRRPLRPEDLSFIKFNEPVSAASVTQLPFLATQRMLLSLNELDIARLPRVGETDDFDRFVRFYSSESRVLGARIRSFLESFAFDFLSSSPPSGGEAADLVFDLEQLLRQETGFWNDALQQLMRRAYVEEGFRFILLQKWCLASTRRIAIARAAASGYFDILDAADRPQLAAGGEDALLRRIAVWCQVPKQEHSYWQFYLSTSLAECNLLYALAGRADRALALVGAAFAAEASWIAFCDLVERAGPCFGVGSRDQHNPRPDRTKKDLLSRATRAFETVGRRYGVRGLSQVGQGLAAARTLAACARNNLQEQLWWLSSIDQYRTMAHMISARIETEAPNIDRETFVEPREMCSTTHVHDDHRLVVIESGKMVFWGNLGMTLRLAPGEMVLVPQGRLHGSSIESPECTYHQPIIPDAWIRSMASKFDDVRAAE